jgi:D-alanine-D-alanine ligase-like ATP-grasp enzyme
MDESKEVEKNGEESDKPPSITPRPIRSWRVAVIANVKGETALPMDGPADAGAEFDRKETIQEIQSAIESDGHTTVFIPGDANLPFALAHIRPDICFNIAEGISGDAREAQIPGILELFRIPYTASRVLTNAVSLDKTMTKRIWRDMGLPTANFQEFITGDEIINSDLDYPLFVKPASEGTGMGMDEGALVNDESTLRRRIHWVIENYHQPALVEEFLPGREFTVAVMGRSDAAQFSPQPHLYATDGFHRFPLLEVDSSHAVTPGIYGHIAKTLHVGEVGVPQFICPATVEEPLATQLQELAINAHNAINALDVSRVDIRLDRNGQPRLMEINTLPGLTRGFSDLCIISEADNLKYRDIILEILYLGASRFGMVTPIDRTAKGIPVQIPDLVPILQHHRHSR